MGIKKIVYLLASLALLCLLILKTCMPEGDNKQQDKNVHEKNFTHQDKRILNVKQFGAAGDGETDDTRAIKEALSNAKNKKVYLPAGTYLISDPLVVKDNTEIYGSDSIIKAKSEGPAMLKILGQNIKIHNLIVDGNHLVLRGLRVMNGTKNVTIHSATFKSFAQPTTKSLSNFTPIAIRIEGGVHNVMMDNLVIKDVFANNVSSEVGWHHKVARGILISPTLAKQPESHNITIKNSTIADIGPKDDGDGIVVQGLKKKVGLKILNNSFHNTHKRAIKIQSPGVLIKDNKIYNSFKLDNFYDTYDEEHYYDMWSAISVYEDHVKIQDNFIGGRGRYSAAVDIAGGSNIDISDNFIANGGKSTYSRSDLIRINTGFYGARKFKTISIKNNHLMNGRYGVHIVAKVSRLKISGNTFSNLKNRTNSPAFRNQFISLPLAYNYLH
ncbi:hypothetical protein D0469_20680 [Peribacillus saganii]|uniref:Rhamnogalacturonase A/B/Epimerase-like pectate lyase domain-containing protein n=1 Tax=Peribacillus saganii TaxID=2303992 RepID=A0A372L9M2_9BACI|nr:glycosyl hydrolase family 28-related protein [Peribacillus saganii]RFU62256.1 hypothetical protein D0469_20680 [Peribacillus saganii]